MPTYSDDCNGSYLATTRVHVQLQTGRAGSQRICPETLAELGFGLTLPPNISRHLLSFLSFFPGELLWKFELMELGLVITRWEGSGTIDAKKRIKIRARVGTCRACIAK